MGSRAPLELLISGLNRSFELVFEDPDDPQSEGKPHGGNKAPGPVTISIFAAGILLLIVLLYFAY